ncbi:MAG: type II toxin-antitoxin system HigB family toxin [bacterium]|nr:type II toxin-antitoxin system HigB family toxin [bacterium]
MRHFASPDYWSCLDSLPGQAQELARKNFELLKQDSRHPSLHFKRVGKYRSVRVGIHYRALAVEIPEGLLWFWIGSHAEYDRILS